MSSGECLSPLIFTQALSPGVFSRAHAYSPRFARSTWDT